MTRRPKDSQARGAEKSSTAKRCVSDDICCLKGIGPKSARALGDKGVGTVKDLLFFFPNRYEDRRRVTQVSDLEEGQDALVWGQVLKAGEERISRAGRQVFKIELGDGTGVIDLVWFNYSRPYLWRLAKVGSRLSAYGRVRVFGHRWQMVHPKTELADSPVRGSIEPVYPRISNLSQKTLKGAI